MNEHARQIAGPEVDRFRQVALATGLAALGICGIAAVGNPAQFFHSYLLAFLFWGGISLGSLGLAMLHQLTGGEWGVVIRGPVESAARTLPLIGALSLPVLLGAGWIYSWAAGGDLPPEQQQYFGIGFVILRTAAYFLIWAGLISLLSKSTRESKPDGRARSGRAFSGPALLLWGVTATFAGVDWIMALEPGWYSTIVGLMFIAGILVAALSFSIVAVGLGALSRADELAPDRWHDLGKLLLTFVMLWAYLAFSQLLIIWAENLPEEIPYYVRRLTGGWLWLGVALVVFHFAVPFFLLLSREIKRSAKALTGLAALVVTMRAADLFWHTGPALSPDSFHVHWMDFALPLGVGGLWIAYFSRQLGRHANTPQVRVQAETGS